jgi:hypothetical protein
VDSVKRGQEAIKQYSELVNALRQLDADWIVAEVEEVVAHGKEVPFGNLSRDENALYEDRLVEEIGRGIPLAHAKANDIIGVPYEPHERLALLVEAVERVVKANELSLSYISEFAAQLGIGSIELEAPAEVDTTAGTPRRRSISLVAPRLTNERLSILRHVLYDEVLN